MLIFVFICQFSISLDTLSLKVFAEYAVLDRSGCDLLVARLCNSRSNLSGTIGVEASLRQLNPDISRNFDSSTIHPGRVRLAPLQRAPVWEERFQNQRLHRAADGTLRWSLPCADLGDPPHWCDAYGSLCRCCKSLDSIITLLYILSHIVLLVLYFAFTLSRFDVHMYMCIVHHLLLRKPLSRARLAGVG